MDSLLDSIRVGVASSATPEQRAAGVLAARTVLAALEAHGGGAGVRAAGPPPVMPPPVMPVPPVAAPSSPASALHENIQTIASALKAGAPIEAVLEVVAKRLEVMVKERDERWLAMMRPAPAAPLGAPMGAPGGPMPSSSAMPTSFAMSPTGAEVAAVRSQAAQIPIVPLPSSPASAAPRPPMAPARAPMPYAQPATPITRAPMPYVQPGAPVARAPMPHAQPAAPGARAPIPYVQPGAPVAREVPPSAAHAPTFHATPAAARSASPSPPVVLRPAPPPQMAGMSPAVAAVPAVAAPVTSVARAPSGAPTSTGQV